MAKSISYTFRLNPDNPSEKRALEIIERNLSALKGDANALRRIMTTALLAMEREHVEPAPRQIGELQETAFLLDEARRLVGDLRKMAATGGAMVVQQAIQETGLDDDFFSGASSLISTQEF